MPTALQAVAGGRAGHHVARPADGISVGFEAGDEARRRRVALLRAARDGVALHVSLGIKMPNVVQMVGESLGHSEVARAAHRAVQAARKLT